MLLTKLYLLAVLLKKNPQIFKDTPGLRYRLLLGTLGQTAAGNV